MGKLKKLYRAKRILAMILAVTMVVSMVPATAYAAPDDSAADLIAESTEVSETIVAGDDQTADTPAVDESGRTEDTQDNSDDAQTTEDTQANPDDASDDTPTAQEDPAPPAASEKPVYAIITDGLDTTAEYTGYRVFYDLSKVKLQETVNGATNKLDALDNGVTYKWSEKKGDSYVDMAVGTEPVNAGSYRATFSYAKVDGVHDGAADVTADFEITKAAATVHVRQINVKPGTAREAVKVEIDYIDTPDSGLAKEDVVLTVADIREAITGTPVAAQGKLKKDGDYVVDIKPDFKADLDAVKKGNYKLEDFTADIVMGELTATKVDITLADRWKEDGSVTLKVYDLAKADAPVSGTDYEVKVQYLDEQSVWKDLTDATTVGEWVAYTGCSKDANGAVEAPTDAGEYTYRLTYKDPQNEYADSYGEITVVIDPAPVTVEMTNTGAITVPEDTALRSVLSKVTYQALRANNKGGKDKIDVKQTHIWGTGYDDANVTQVYEPLFTLQVKKGAAWEDIEDADYRVRSGAEYRIIYDGKKAIYNADGTYSHRTGINAGLDGVEAINGVDGNYLTDETPTAADQALTVNVTPGTEVEWDISALLGDKSANANLDGSGVKAKDYDNKTIYSSKSEIKNKVKLVAGNKSIPAVGEDFTYTWYVHREAKDLLDKEIIDENKANGFRTDDFYDADKWEQPSDVNGSPWRPGIYKLEISYEDNTDDGTYYYVKDQKPAVAYYVINRVELQIVPKADDSYETLAGRYVVDYFDAKEITYQILNKGQEYTFPQGQGAIKPYWVALKMQKQADDSVIKTGQYSQYSYHSFVYDEGTTAYKIQAQGLQWEDSYNEGTIGDTIYTTKTSKKVAVGVPDANGKAEVGRQEEELGTEVSLTVKPMGTTKLNVSVDAANMLSYEKVYDAELLARDILPVVKITKTENGQEVAVTDPGLEYYCIRKDDSEWFSFEYTRDAGEYEVYAAFYGDETYAPLDNDVKVGTVKITKRPIGLQVKTAETYDAGTRVSRVLSDIRGNITVTGYAKADESAFTSYSMNAWNSGTPSFRIYEKGKKTPLYNSDILHRNKAYEVHYNPDGNALNRGGYIADEYEYRDVDFNRNYEVTTTAETVLAEFSAVTTPATIESVRLGSVEKLAVSSTPATDTAGNIKQTVEIPEGISYTSYTLSDYNNKKVTGNLAAFKITVPAEYQNAIPDTAMYQNEVEKAGGYVVSKYKSSGYFTVLFDAKEGSKTFKVRWEDNYVETFVLDFKADQLLGNLEDAVAPKSLAFNNPSKKMAVGSSQQLDVKITKAQMGDIISLGYKSSDEKTLIVNQNGQVTALKKGKATIEAYPQHMDGDGRMVPIPNAKSASVVIEAAAVTAPKPVKVSAHGTYADVNYDTPKDGYRREIYVVKGAKKEADIKPLVEGMKNDQWKGTFAIAPVYQDSADERLNRSRNKYTVRLEGLEIKEQYTVYVRNVCAARTLADGSVVTQATVNESAAGTVVSFKTLKSEIAALHINCKTVDGVTNVTYPNEWDYDDDYIGNRIVADLSKVATVESVTFGEFFTNVKDPSADAEDTFYHALPLSDKEDKDYYEEPKLEYALEYYNTKTQRYEWGQKNAFASIDKKGKIKLTGVSSYTDCYDSSDPHVRVRVRDTVTGKEAFFRLYIIANTDSVTAKKKSINIPVGQYINLNDSSLYSYKAGKKKLTDYRYPSMDLDSEAVKAAVEAQKEYFELDSNSLYAIKAGGTLTLSLTDRNIAKVNPNNATVQITFSSKELAPVKKLKAYDVTDDRFGLTFTHEGGFNAVRLEITEGSGRKICDKQVELWDGIDQLTDPKTNNYVKDTYYIDPSTIRSLAPKLTKESQYTVKVTALYNSIAAKTVSAKVKTTKLPAYRDWIEDEYVYERDEDGNVISYTVIKPRGGMSIRVSDSSQYLTEDSTWLYALSGNSYTLTAQVSSDRGRVSDTLVWSVSNGKVASVKAAAGSYSITLKGLQPGSTMLEVKSKILGNKVVARYDIYVVAVGDAYKNGSAVRYYGDNEPGEWSNPWISNGGNNAPDYLPLGVGDLRKVTANNSTDQFSFTAPETGKYQFKATGYDTRYASVTLRKKTAKNEPWKNVNGGDLGWLNEGETVYLSAYCSSNSVNLANNAYYVGVNLTQRIESLGVGETEVTGKGRNEYFKFTAPENAYYQFSAANGNTQKYLYLYTSEQDAVSGYTYNAVASGNTVEREIKAGDSVWLSCSGSLANGTKYTFKAEKISEDMKLNEAKSVTLKAGETKYLVFSVDKDGYYEFSSTADAPSADVTAQMSVNGNEDYNNYASSSVFTMKRDIQSVDVVCLKVTNSGSADASFTVSAKDITPKDLSTAGTTLPSGTAFYKFTAQTAGAYQFSVTVDAASASDTELSIWGSMDDANNGYGALASAGAATTADNKSTYTVGLFLEAGQTIYIGLTNNTGADLQAAVSGGADTMPQLTAGSSRNIDLKVGEESRVIFTAPKTGVYAFTTGEVTTYIPFGLYKGGAYMAAGSNLSERVDVYSGGSLNKKLLLQAGQTIVWTMKPNAEITISLSVTLTKEIQELKLGEAVTASYGSLEADGFMFTAPTAGYYTFYASGDDDSYGILYDLKDININTCLLHDNRNTSGCLTYDDSSGPGNDNFAIRWNLQAGQTVYLKVLNFSGNAGTPTVYVEAGQKFFGE